MSEKSDVELINDSRQTQRPWHGPRLWLAEHAVFMTITSLMFLSGMTTAVEIAKLLQINNKNVLDVWKLCQTILPVSAIFGMMFLSNYIGRRPAIIFLFVLSILSSVLYSTSRQNMWFFLAFIIHGISNGCTIFMTFITIWEYSSSKRKLTYSLINVGVWQMAESFTKKVLYRGDVIENDSLLMKTLPIVVALVCIELTWNWPESPYWLASQGRNEESRASFLWLHGEEGEEELQSLLQAQREPGPPIIYSLSNFLEMLSISIYNIAVWYKSYAKYNTGLNFVSKEFKTGLIVCSTIWIVGCTVVVLKNIQRKFMAITFFGVLVAFYMFWCLGEPLSVELPPSLIRVLNSVTSILENGGPILLSLTLVVMAVPQNYKSLAYAFISYINFAISSIIFMLAILMIYTS